MTSPVVGWLAQHRLKLSLSLLVLLASVGLLRAAHLPLWPGLANMQQVEASGVAAYVLLWSGVHLVRALRWGLLLRPLGTVSMREVVSASFVGFAAIVLLPLRSGEVVRPALIRRSGHVSGWAALGTIGAERIIDGLLLTVMLTLSMAVTHVIEPLPDHIGDLPISVGVVPGATQACLLLFATAFALMFLFYFARDFSQHALQATLGKLMPNLATAVGVRLAKLGDGLGFLKDWKLSSAFSLVSLVYWMVNAYANLVLAEACGLHAMGFGQACVVTGVLALGILVPNAPGFFGAFQFAIYAALAMYFQDDVVLAQGPGYVFLIYASQMGITVVAAAVGWALVPRAGELVEPQSAAKDERARFGGWGLG